MSATTPGDTVPAGPPTRVRLLRFWNQTKTVILPLTVLALIGVVWEASVNFFEIPKFLFPSLSTIWNEYFIGDAPILIHVLATTKTVALGFGLSLIISAPLAVMIASSGLIANAIYPILVLTQAIPKIAVAPLLVVLLGAGEAPRLMVTFLVAFFPLVASFATGLLATPPDLIELGRAYNSSWWQQLYHIRLPWSVPFLFSGLKISATFAVVGAVVGEFVAADRGLGYQIMSATAFFNTPVSFGALILLSIMGIAIFQSVVIIERVFFPWSVSAASE